MFKKAKKSIAWLAVLVLAFSLFAGYFATIHFASAAATRPFDFFTGIIASKVEYNDSFDVPASTGTYTVAVKSPNGTTVAPVGNKVKATQLGIYEVTITRTDATKGFYKYNVESYLEGDYILVVDKGAATIPSFWEYKTGGKKIELPDAAVYVYDEDDNIYVKDFSQNIKVTVTAPEAAAVEYVVDKSAGTVSKNGGAATVNTKTYIDDIDPNTGNKGTWFFTYSAAIDGGTEILTKQYTMQTQNQFEDDKAPTLSPASLPPSTASVNTKVTVPLANVSDNYDTRVIVDISVKHTYSGSTVAENVKKVDVDKKTGYVSRDAQGNPVFKDKNNADTSVRGSAEDVTFDNDMFMYFYPTEVGTYTVTYKAEDTSHYYQVSSNNKNATIEYVYTIYVTDTTAPIFDKIDDYKIPTDWSADIKKFSDTDSDGEKLTGKALNIEFPIPEVYDNNTKADDITIHFNFTDPSGRTVASFENINATTASEKSKYTSANDLKAPGGSSLPYYFFRYEGNYTVDAAGLLRPIGGGEAIGYDFRSAFNFSNWNPSYNDASKYGSYSVTYRAYDTAAASNFQTQGYTFRYSTSYSDTTAPSIYFVAPKTINFTNNKEEVSITGVSVTDSSASRVNSEYYLVFDAADGYTKDTFDTLISNNDKKVKLSSSLGTNKMEVRKTAADGCTVTVNDERGIKQTIKNIDYSKYIYVAVKATDSVGNETIRVEKINPIDATDTTKTATIATNGYKGGPANNSLNAAEGTSGTEYLLGNYIIDFVDYENRKQSGFELYVQRVTDGSKAVDESPLTNVTFETYSVNNEAATDSKKVYVDNVRFTPNSAGTYMVVIRAYNISGNSNAHISYVDVTGATVDGGNPTEASAISTTSDLNVTYSLTSNFTAAANSYVVRSIKGGRMSLMYDQFTAMSRTTYTFKDYTAVTVPNNRVQYADKTAKVPYRPLNNDATDAKSQSNYSTAVYDNEMPEIKLQDVMPSYTALNKVVNLPAVSAFSRNGIASKLECTVTDNDGYPVDTTEAAAGGNAYSFTADKNGKYTVTYKATLNGNVSTETFEIKAGDVTAPVFTILDTGLANSTSQAIIGYINDQRILSNSSSSITATIGDEFKFGVINCSDDSTSGYSYLKQLISADNEVVDSVTSANLRSNSSKITFTMSGQYTVKYSVTDKYGNTSTLMYTITVNSSTSKVSAEAITTLSTVLIIVGIILIAGVVIYLVRFRKRKRA